MRQYIRASLVENWFISCVFGCLQNYEIYTQKGILRMQSDASQT